MFSQFARKPPVAFSARANFQKDRNVEISAMSVKMNDVIRLASPALALRKRFAQLLEGWRSQHIEFKPFFARRVGQTFDHIARHRTERHIGTSAWSADHQQNPHLVAGWGL